MRLWCENDDRTIQTLFPLAVIRCYACVLLREAVFQDGSCLCSRHRVDDTRYTDIYFLNQKCLQGVACVESAAQQLIRSSAAARCKLNEYIFLVLCYYDVASALFE